MTTDDNPGGSVEGPAGPVMVVAGEASGDHHAAGLINALGGEAPGLSYFGMGGQRMSAAGVELVHDAGELAVMGIAEVAGSLGKALATYRSLKKSLVERQAVGAILVDFPEFNLRLARFASRRGIPVVLFVSPQIWAWRPGRVHTVARFADRMICILPFETAFYRRHGVSAVYVGHPLIDAMQDNPDGPTARRRLGVGQGDSLLALLPGSRRQEIRLMARPMLEAAQRLRRDVGIDHICLPVAPTLSPEEVASAAGDPALLAGVELTDDPFLTLAAADFAVVASGTSTLIAALTSTPMVVGYRVHPLTYAIGRYLTNVDHVALVNLVAGRRLVPERIQDDFTAEQLCAELRHLMTSPGAAREQKEGFEEVRRRLGPPGVFPRAAEAVMATLHKARSGGRPAFDSSRKGRVVSES